ncbi:helix-turn-helix domain-containing protein [Brevibacillus formosus]|uniref:helix-turn-helix domain-containing protein n=1 Tax=Brevibacillus formosus TaxID=54913 RepID=UPI003F1C52F2
MAVEVGRCLLKDRLKDAHMTQAELADKLDLSPQRVSDYANNLRTIPINRLREIAQILRCHMDDLYEWIEVPGSRHKK